MSPSSRRTSAVPNEQGDKALYSIITQTPGIPSTITETRISNLQTGTSTRFFKGAYDREAIWLGIENLVIWLKDVPLKATEIWIADAVESQAKYAKQKYIDMCICIYIYSLSKRLPSHGKRFTDVSIVAIAPAGLQHWLLISRSKDFATNMMILLSLLPALQQRPETPTIPRLISRRELMEFTVTQFGILP